MEKQQNFNQDPEIKEVEKTGSSIVVSAKDIVIDSREMQEEGADCLVIIKRNLDRIEERRTFYTKPLNDLMRRVNSEAKAIKEPFEKAQSEIKSKINKYQCFLLEEKRKADLKAEKKIEKAVEKGEEIPVVPEAHVEKNIKTENTTVSFRDNWKAQIVDPKKLMDWAIENKKVSLLQINNTALNQLEKFTKDTEVIPGVRIINDKIISTKAK